MKTITIIGIGVCHDTVTIQGLRAIEAAGLLLGGARNLAHFEYMGKRALPEWEAAKIARIVEGDPAENIAVLMSGDVGFYSGAARLAEALKAHDVTTIPGVSTVQYFFAKLQRPWQNARLVSMHGGSQDIVAAVAAHAETFCLTSRDKAKIAGRLSAAGFGGLTVYVGDDLGAENERVFETTVDNLNSRLTPESRTVLLILNPSP